MTDFQETSSDRARIGRELRRIASRLGLDSDVKISNEIGEDRGMVSRVLGGDPTVSERKWRTVEEKIRDLDHAMGSEHDDATAAANVHRVKVRYSTTPGVEFMVEGHISDLPELEDAILRLVKRAEGSEE